MKHLLKSLVDLMQLVVPWLKQHADEQFQLVQVNVITAFVNLISDSTVDHVSEVANHILDLAIGTNEGDKLQEILYSHLLSLCFVVVDEEVNMEDRFVTFTLYLHKSCSLICARYFYHIAHELLVFSPSDRVENILTSRCNSL